MSDELPDPPESARHVFGAALPDAVRYAELLASDGVVHGLIGPREVPVLWSRHLVNCALVTDLVPTGARVLDIGSGAGLPGVPMALRRPDLELVLLEPKQRRVAFLEDAVARLELSERVRVVRGRTDDDSIRRSWGGQEFITARAVAPLARLVRWSLPLLAPDGRLLALKGASVNDEVERDRAEITRSGGTTPTVVELGGGESGDQTWIVSVGRRTAAGQARNRRTR